jgi:hypothetical protein
VDAKGVLWGELLMDDYKRDLLNCANVKGSWPVWGSEHESRAGMCDWRFPWRRLQRGAKILLFASVASAQTIRGR